MNIVYYSRGSLIPALFCAEKHHRPDGSSDQTYHHVRQWLLQQNHEPDEVLLLPYKNGEEGVPLYVMTAAAPQGLVERTLSNLFALLQPQKEPDPFVLVSSLPFSCSSSSGEQAQLACFRKKLIKLWPEIGAAVSQARLQIALQKRYS